MKATTEHIFIEALSLPSKVRAALAQKLLVSLGGDEASPDIEAAWKKEAKSRYEAFKKGKISARSSAEVMRDAYRKRSEADSDAFKS